MKTLSLSVLLVASAQAFVAPLNSKTPRSTSALAATKPVVDVFWSMRSPYCYISLDRCLALRQDYDIDLVLRPVYPIAIRDTAYFTGISEYMYYRIPYQGIDTVRSAQFAGMPYLYPRPDPVLQEPNFGPVKPFDEQVLIQKLTRTAVAACDQGLGWEYLNQVSRMMWNGMVNGWDQGDWDGDGWDDIFITVPQGVSALFHNNGDTTFTSTEAMKSMSVERTRG